MGCFLIPHLIILERCDYAPESILDWPFVLRNHFFHHRIIETVKQKYIAEIAEFSLKDYDQAIIEYQNLINFSKDEFSNAEHQFRIASIYYKKQNYHQALVELQILLENYPKSAWAEETKFKIVEILYALNRCPEARERYRQFNLEYSNSRFKSEMDFVVASCLEEEGHLQDAYNLFKALEGQYTYPSILKMKLLGIEKRIEKVR